MPMCWLQWLLFWIFFELPHLCRRGQAAVPVKNPVVQNLRTEVSEVMIAVGRRATYLVAFNFNLDSALC